VRAVRCSGNSWFQKLNTLLTVLHANLVLHTACRVYVKKEKCSIVVHAVTRLFFSSRRKSGLLAIKELRPVIAWEVFLFSSHVINIVQAYANSTRLYEFGPVDATVHHVP